ERCRPAAHGQSRAQALVLHKLHPPAGLCEIHAQAAVPRPHAAERNLQCACWLSELPHLHWRSRYILALIIFAARVDVLVHYQNPSVLLWNQVQTESSGRNLGLLESERGSVNSTIGEPPGAQTFPF